MRRLASVLLASMALVLAACQASTQSSAAQYDQSSKEASVSPKASDDLTLVPYPDQVERKGGELVFTPQLSVMRSPNTDISGRALNKLFSDLGIKRSNSAPVEVHMHLSPTASDHAEGYQLTINDGIHIYANTDVGLFYGVQTLRQLLPAVAQSEYRLPQLHIKDQPRFGYRGSMVDVARHFLPLSYLKKHIERMALFKLNRLHLHLTDDQGWRVEIKAYPKLALVGGSTQVDGGGGGYYTQDEIRELVVYAKQHAIEIVPEIDMPGHIQAAIASYPSIACDDHTSFELYEGKEVGWTSLCLREPERVYPFVEAVLTELADLFPYEYLHIGGDEIENPHYAEFITRADAIVESLGRKTAAWEEASKGDLRSESLLQLWNDEYDIQPAIDKGIHLILSPCSYTYFDHGNYAGQPNTYDWCTKEGVSLERVYSFDPSIFPLPVGVEAPLWTEMVKGEADADNRQWPRLAAIAEVSWTPQAQRDYSQFTQRLSPLKPHLDELGVQYYAEPDLSWD